MSVSFSTKTNQTEYKNYQVAAGQKNPNVFKSIGNGIGQKIAMSVPIYGTYKIGKQIVEQDNLQKCMQTGEFGEKHSAGFFKSYAKGLGMKLAQVVPFYGTYKVGKEIVEQRNIQEAIRTGNKEKANKKTGFFKSYFAGLKMKVAQLFPIIGTYELGKEVATHKTINKLT